MRCAVLNCRNRKSKDNTLYSFPTDEVLRDKWVRFCGVDTLDLKRSVICSDHFTPNDCQNDLKFRMGFCRRRLLLPGAVPTLKPKDSPNPREARIRKKDHRRLIDELLKKSTTPPKKTENELEFETDINNLNANFTIPAELPHNEVELNEDPFKDTHEYLGQDEISKDYDDDDDNDGGQLVICDGENQKGLGEIEDEPLIELSTAFTDPAQSTQIKFAKTNGYRYENKIKFNVDFPLAPRTIILPISTRAVGFIIRHIASYLWRLQLKEIELYRFTNALYRLALLQLDMKISTAMQSNFIRNTGGRAFINVTLPEPVRQMLNEMIENFAPLATYLAAIGFVRTLTAIYLPRYPRTKEDYPCDPVNVRFSLLRILVMRLTSMKTAPDIRKKFFELNPIPGAIWDASSNTTVEEASIPLLKNADDIMPPGYGLHHLRADCKLIKNSIEKIVKKYPKFVNTGGIDWRGKGSMAQLVSSSVIPVRCPSYNVDRLTSIVGEHDHFWSLQNIAKEEFCLGVFCLVGETGSVQHQECFAPRMLESSCQEGDLNFTNVLQTVFKQLF